MLLLFGEKICHGQNNMIGKFIGVVVWCEAVMRIEFYPALLMFLRRLNALIVRVSK
jgi:hypothetical protein